MVVGITGGTGFIGSHLSNLLLQAGHTVVCFSRQATPKWKTDMWQQTTFVETRLLSSSRAPDISDLDALVNLAGEPLLGVWTPAKKRRIRNSRVDCTRRLIEAIALSPKYPRILINGSAIGFYGDTGNTLVDEDSPPGTGFLAEVAQQWETEALRAESFDVRVVLIRTGFVLGKDGGALKLMKPFFKFGIGGKLGSGKQWMACIHVDDVANLILHALETPSLRGPLNAVMPEPITNTVFTKAFAKTCHRPAVIPLPSLALHITLGELSHLLLDSQRVAPKRTQASGFHYQYSTIHAALEGS